MKRLHYILIILGCISCKHKTEVAPVNVSVPGYFTNVLILGNSITFSSANPAIGWNNNWGMAASTAEQDYVHLLTAKFKSINKNCTVNGYNISAFEFGYSNYNIDANLKTYRDTKPDLIILRIGENVQTPFDSVAFDKQYQSLINYFKSNNAGVKILGAGAFWPQRDYINSVMSKHPPYIGLDSLGQNISNYAFYLANADPSVQGHPGDKGMQAIADALWAKILTL